MVATCRIVRSNPGGKPLVCERSFSMSDASRAGLSGRQPYRQYPERMLSWRAFWMAARDIYSDVLAGLPGGEEMEDLEVSLTAKASPPSDGGSAVDRVAAAASKITVAPVEAEENLPPPFEPEPIFPHSRKEELAAVVAENLNEAAIDEGTAKEFAERSAEAVKLLGLQSPFDVRVMTKPEMMQALGTVLRDKGIKPIHLKVAAKANGIPYSGGRPESLKKKELHDLLIAAMEMERVPGDE